MSELKKATMDHYNRLVSCRTYDEFLSEGWGMKTCPLCQSYHGFTSCSDKCPVKKKTGRDSCRETPYAVMSSKIRELKHDVIKSPLPEVVAMREFLDSLDWSEQPYSVGGPTMSELKKATMEHYDRLVSCRTYDEFLSEGWGSTTCPLCRQYTCDGCPVMRKTGEPTCYNTPWWDMDQDIISMSRNSILYEPLPSVLVMREFLKSLDWSDQP